MAGEESKTAWEGCREPKLRLSYEGLGWDDLYFKGIHEASDLAGAQHDYAAAGGTTTQSRLYLHDPAKLCQTNGNDGLNV